MYLPQCLNFHSAFEQRGCWLRGQTEVLVHLAGGGAGAMRVKRYGEVLLCGRIASGQQIDQLAYPVSAKQTE